MPVKVNVGLSKKIGQPDYGSLGASCNVEFELDGSYDNGSTTRFQDAVRRAYVACREAVETEIRTQSGQPSTGDTSQHSSTTSGYGDRTPERGATSSQVRAIHAISGRHGVDLQSLLTSRFQVAKPDDLSIRQASSLIDELKNGTGDRYGNGASS